MIVLAFIGLIGLGATILLRATETTPDSAPDAANN
jgi:hypothetical protein